MSRVNSMLFVALILGLGWAIRGHFGHEWGASWAGGMAALAVLVAARRSDWMQRAPVLTALGAIGWAVGGMMSYGVVIGYCRGTGFGNVAYGYTMLAVIGGLYGFIGGGFFGLGLESSAAKKPKWPALITEMVAGAYIVWGLIVYQLEWFMTPPRSELWAACAGAAAALAWHLYREGYYRALRVAGYSMLGAGFGFAFGNFIQTIGAVSDINYNWWNVMEFTLGFCGGLGMAYAIVTRDWPESVKPSKTANWLGVIFVALAIPLTNFIEAFRKEKFLEMAEHLNLADPDLYASNQIMLGTVIFAIFLIVTIIIWQRCGKDKDNVISKTITIAVFAYSFYYMIYGFIVKGFFCRTFSFEHSDALYAPILIIAFILWFLNRDKKVTLPLVKTDYESWRRWILIVSIVILIIIIITLISINSHPGISGFHERF